MKRWHSSNARRSRFSRSASSVAASPRGWRTSIAVILGGTLLLVSVFYLQARLGGFGSGLRGRSVEIENERDDLVLDQRLRVSGRKSVVESGKKIELNDLEEENAEFENLDRVGERIEELDDDDLEIDDAVIGDVDLSKQDQESRQDDDDDFDGDEKDESEDEQEEETPKVSLPEESREEKEKKNKTEKRLERLGQIQTLDRFSPGEREISSTGKEAGKVTWDGVLGVVKMPLDAKAVTFGARKLGLGKNFSQVVMKDGSEKQGFSSDDEPLDANEVVDVEDALFLKREKHLSSKLLGSSASLKQRVPPKNVFDASFAKRILRPPVDPLANTLLQDPDTVEPWGLTKSDRAMSRIFRKSALEEAISDATDIEETASVLEEKNAKTGKGRKELLGMREGRKRSRKPRKRDTRKWGYFPGIDPTLSFSEFMDQFLREDKCDLYVFQAWNSPPWSYTVRHQRGLESIFHFHPKACVAVFSETIELEFFNKFAKKGLRVAVARPNLEELLQGTSAEMFASVWVEWRRIELFYIHYSELLRLAALYKYGGVYLDSDVIALRPLLPLHNAVGLETLADGNTRLNGAVMAFGKASSFIKECLDEYTATYDDKRMEWNGADLLTRVARRPLHDETSQTWEDNSQHLLRVLPSSSFFPLSSSNVTRYFYGAATKEEERYEEKLKEQLLVHSYAFHLWDRVTKALVPQSHSLVGIVLEQHCIYCDDVI